MKSRSSGSRSRDAAQSLDPVPNSIAKRVTTRRALPQCNPEREEVRPGVDLSLEVVELFRRGVARCEHSVVLRSRRCGLEIEVARDTEVEKPEVPGVVEHQVVGLHVSMNDPDALARLKCLQRVLRETPEFLRSQHPRTDDAAKAVSRDELLANPDELSHRRNQQVGIQDPRHPRRSDPLDREDLPPDPLRVRSWLDHLEDDVTITSVTSPVDPFLPSTRERRQSEEVRKLPRKPREVDHAVRLFGRCVIEASSQALSLNSHDAKDMGCRSMVEGASKTGVFSPSTHTPTPARRACVRRVLLRGTAGTRT